jgi:hypothetical protein
MELSSSLTPALAFGCTELKIGLASQRHARRAIRCGVNIAAVDYHTTAFTPFRFRFGQLAISGTVASATRSRIKQFDDKKGLARTRKPRAKSTGEF